MTAFFIVLDILSSVIAWRYLILVVFIMINYGSFNIYTKTFDVENSLSVSLYKNVAVYVPYLQPIDTFGGVNNSDSNTHTIYYAHVTYNVPADAANIQYISE